MCRKWLTTPRRPQLPHRSHCRAGLAKALFLVANVFLVWWSINTIAEIEGRLVRPPPPT